MNKECQIKAIEHARECIPNESCGLFLQTTHGFEYFKCKNISHELKTESFIIDPLDYADGEDKGKVVGIVHSHPQNVLEFSESDKASCNAIKIPFYLVCPDLDKMIVINPTR